ncbi:MarR family winged helix-turn-helix transcriptional regulator [Bacillus sp. S/N-304-OC-R1]|uniref:MarR family winged helix-turn-helix transcriptional regulator n=1 Tax=Bacillus sp. S/N-304-OC-R1 TaxID=2758034 RepID=UPI001C8F1273|nr:MarR family transcriptional regulator [Bacillus sp. S/N-304-OC-R1]MBY0123677.1 MarR family transcriptional regulator [Bacillus sp. S/N-304-OC-R1]
MTDKIIKELINKYIELSFSVQRKAECLVKEQIGSDLTNDQHYTLRYISNVGSCTSSQLAEQFNVQKSAITAIITRLFEKGLIQRTRDENDRRVVYLTLTDKGNELFNQTEERIYKLVESFITQFDQEEITQFIKTYEKLNQILIESKNPQVEE